MLTVYLSSCTYQFRLKVPYDSELRWWGQEAIECVSGQSRVRNKLNNTTGEEKIARYPELGSYWYTVLSTVPRIINTESYYSGRGQSRCTK